MNKYEESLFKRIVTSCIVSIKDCNDDVNNNYTLDFNYEDSNIVLRQNENITLTKYQLVFVLSNINSIENIDFSIKGKKFSARLIDSNNVNLLFLPEIFEKYDGKAFLYVVDIDFDNKTDFIEFKFMNNIVDPIKIDINYIDANKDRYYQKLENERVKGLLNKLSLNCKVGDSLVNFYWQNASDDVEKTRIEVFLDNKQLIMREDLGSGMMFKSIQGLAYGTYLYKVTQYDKNNSIIVETDMGAFTIAKPESKSNRGIFGNGKPTIHNW